MIIGAVDGMARDAGGRITQRRHGPGAAWRWSLLCATALVTGAVVTGATALPALAQQAQAAPAAPLETLPTRPFDIPAQPLDQALAAFGAASGVQIVYDSALAAGHRSQAVRGTLRADQALARMLAGTGLDYRFSGARAATILGSGSTVDLGPLVVQESRLASGTGPVTGYVAPTSVSGTKTDTPLIETPQSISVITADQIADQKATTVEDALAYTAGVRISGSGSDPRFDQMQIRGFSATSTGDYLDGLRQPNTGWLSYFRTEPFNLERIDVLKGPASVLYGQGETGGMVNRVSKRPTGDKIREVEIQTGDPYRLQAQFDLGDKLVPDGRLSYRLVGVARDSEKTIEQIDDDRIFLAPSLTWRADDDTSLTLFGQYQHDRTAGSPRPYQYPNGQLSRIWGGDEGYDRLEQTQILAGYTLTHHLDDAITLRQNLRYGHVDTDNQYLSGAGLADDGHTLNRSAIGVYERMQSLGVDNQAEFRFDTGRARHTLLAGLDYLWTDGDIDYMSGAAPSLDLLNPDYNQPVGTPTTALALSSIRDSQIGVYLQDQIALDRWRVTLALRQDWADGRTTNRKTGVTTTDTDDALTGRVGVLYLTDMGLAPYASYSTSFNPQSGVDAFGARLRPTEGEQYEIGLKYQPPGMQSMITAALYDLTKTNITTPYIDGNGNIDPSRSIQTGEVNGRGLELEAHANLARGLNLIASYTWQDMEITATNQGITTTDPDGNKGNTPLGVPEHMASAWLDYTHPTGSLAGLGGGLGLRYVGESYVDNANSGTNDAETLADATIRYDFSGARLALNVRNLTDRDVITCESGYCYRGEGRTVIASLRYRW